MNLTTFRPWPSDTSHFDEVVIPTRGKTHWLGRAVDANGDTFEILQQANRNAKAAKRFLRTRKKRQYIHRIILTD